MVNQTVRKLLFSWQLASSLPKTRLATSRSASRYLMVERICCNLLAFLEKREKLEWAEVLLGGSFVPAKRDKRSRKIEPTIPPYERRERKWTKRGYAR